MSSLQADFNRGLGTQFAGLLFAVPSAKIAEAVRSCLAECEPARSPFVRLHLFIERLREKPGWTWKEVREVEWRVTQILKTLMDDTYWVITSSDSAWPDGANRPSHRRRPLHH